MVEPIQYLYTEWGAENSRFDIILGRLTLVLPEWGNVTWEGVDGKFVFTHVLSANMQWFLTFSEAQNPRKYHACVHRTISTWN